MKYTIRKLGLILVLVLLGAAPFAKAEYDRRTTTDPFILMAREIEDFSPGEVDVINVFQSANDLNQLVVLLNIPSMPDWPKTKPENLKRYVLQVIRGSRYNKVLIGIGWDYPAENLTVQGIYICTELKTDSCSWELTSTKILPDFVKWPGIGRP